MTKSGKEFRPKARIPRGFRDRIGAEIAAERDMLARISAVYESFGFDPLETPAFEYTDALGKFLPDLDRPNQGVFSLKDDDEQWLSLRYDLTAPLARYVAENYDALPKPFRRYQVGPVWRNEKPGPGRYRQFTQCDADTVGAPAPAADAEMCMLIDETMRALGFTSDQFVVRVSSRKIVDALFEAIGLGDGATRATVLRAMDKFDRLGEPGVRALLGSGRKDESGDFTKGAGLDGAKSDRILQFLTASGSIKFKRPSTVVAGPQSQSSALDEIASLLNNQTGQQAIEMLRGLSESIPGFGARSIAFDWSVIRGLDYYTDTVFEVDLDLGDAIKVGSVAGGGRYDGLVKRFKGVEVPAVGVSLGVSRLLAALELKESASAEAAGPVVVLALEDDQMAEYQEMAAELRAAGLRAEVYVGGGGMKAQLKYADKRRAPAAIIVGEDERKKGEVTIKNLVLGAELSKGIADNVEWREGQKAQVSVPRARLVEEVKRLLS